MGKGFLMCNEIHEWIESNIPKGGTILELGSGKGTLRLVENYTVYSIEHSKKWMNKYGSNYIYAPIKNKWYDIEAIKKGIPEHYDVLLVDGPPRKIDGVKIGRLPLFDHLDLFNTDVPIIIDDADRGREMKLIELMKEFLGRECITYKGRDHRGKGTRYAIFDKIEKG
jgi:hypothetical protein